MDRVASGCAVKVLYVPGLSLLGVVCLCSTLKALVSIQYAKDDQRA